MWQIGGKEFKSRMLLGTSKYPTAEALLESIRRSKAEIVTVSLRRHSHGDGEGFWKLIKDLGVTLLPNTAGCRSVQEAVTTARMAREIFGTNWIKLETVGDEYTLQPDPFALVEAAGILVREGFEVFPYTTEDLVVAERLVAAGCRILMPWASPIGSGQGILHLHALRTLRARFPSSRVQFIVDAGIGVPSDATQVMELGFDGVLLNSAVSQAQVPQKMAEAFSLAIRAGRLGFKAGLMEPRDFACPSTPVMGTAFC